MTKKRVIKTDEESINEVRNVAEDFRRWATLANSASGKFLLTWLDNAIEETLDNEDKADIYKMDSQAREYFFASVRSKRQTLKAIKTKLLTAETEWQRWAQELSKLVPENE